MASINDRIARLSPEKQAQLLQRLESKRAESGRTGLTSAIPHQPGRTAAPVSFTQQSLWFLDQLEGGSDQYGMPAAVRLQGRLDSAALEHSLAEIVRRHAVLRTTFSAPDGAPRQVIHPYAGYTLPVIDLTGLAPADKETAVQARLTALTQVRFDLSAGPLFQAQLLTLGEGDHILLICMHHIISDGLSTAVLVRELAQFYAAFSRAADPRLPDLPVQYGDYAEWQHNRLKAERLDDLLDYWTRQLSGAPQLLELPTDYHRPTVQSHRGAHLPFHLTTGLAGQIRALSEQNGASLFMTLLAAFYVLLYRYTGQTDLCIGTPVANRPQAELEGLIGFFANTLVLRETLSGQMSFRDLLRQVKETCLGAFAHQELPFDLLVESLKVPRSLSYSPLFQVIFAYEDAPLQRLAMPGLAVELIEIETHTAKFDLVFNISDHGREIGGYLEYCTDLFDEATIQRLSANYSTLLESIAGAPDVAIADLPVIHPAERRLLLETWNQTAQAYPADRCAYQLFEEWAARQPDAPAVDFDGQVTTYAGLNRQANQIASILMARGIGKEDRVGLCLPRSSAMIAAILGVQKAGAAYVPLDPANPPDRLGFIMADAGLRVVIGHPDTVDLLHSIAPSLAVLDLSDPAFEQAWGENPLPQASPDALAYVIYTSGSTGRPKGVLLEHRGLTNLACDYAQRIGMSPRGRALQFFTYNFDGSIADIFTPLISGGTICTAQRETLLPGPDLVAFLRDRRVTHALLTPSTLAALPCVDLPDLEVLAFGGEAMTRPIIGPWVSCLGRRRRLINVYGPTEVTVIATTYEVEDLDREADNIPIGRPISNLAAYILDERLNLAPIGAAGELYIGGVGVARGYLNRPELTGSRFIANPFKPGQRLYKTGDVARRRADGVIEFLGRSDNQVKIRGFRIELGEIEAALLNHPAVKDTTVWVSEADGQKQLVGYLVLTNPANPPAAADLREALKTSLPEYMIPAYFVVLDAIPMTINSKIDRKALPLPGCPGTLEAPSEQSGPAPANRSQTEEILAGIWTSLLGVQSIHSDHNFFDIGGHSLLAAQVLARVRDTFKVELSLRTLFEAPTLSGLARAIDLHLRDGFLPQIIIPLTGPRTQAPLSFAQERLWFLDQLEPGKSDYNIALCARVTGSLDFAAVRSALAAVVARHSILRTAILTQEGVGRQAILEQVDLPFTLVGLDELPELDREAAARQLIEAEARRPFDLSAAPLFRFTAVQVAPEVTLVLLTLHHIITDGWSTGVMVQELAEHYTAVVNGQAPVLPDLPIQYADYADWQRSQFRGAVMESQIAYWRDQLNGLPPRLALPTDRPRPAVQTSRGQLYSFMIGPEITERLKRVCQAEGVTQFMALLAAFQVLLYRYTGQADFAIGTPVANRGAQNIENLIGLFVNTLVLRANLDDRPDFQTLLKRVRETCLSAYAHQEMPFELLVDVLQIERSLSHNPLFQVMFAYQNLQIPVQPFPPHPTEWINVDLGIATFDLTLLIGERPEGLTAQLEYNADLFDESTIARMAGHYLTLITGALDHLTQPVTQLPLLTAPEQEQVVKDWNQTERADPRLGLAVHQLFEQQAAANPRAAAVYSPAEGLQLTYADLNHRANQLARCLVDRGIQPQSHIAVCLPRSADAIVSILAVLKAGGVYLPIDPDYPAERIAWMLEDAQASQVITRGSLTGCFAEFPVEICDLDACRAEVDQQPSGNLDLPTGPDRLAYTIFTSGSTGKPKGVLVEHHALVNHNLAAAELFQLTSQDRVLQFASLSFDTSLEEIFPTLLSGAQLVLRPQGQLPTGADLCGWAAEWGLTVLDLPTSYWHTWVDEISLNASARPAGGAGQTGNGWSGLRLVIVGGEKALPDKLAAWQQTVPSGLRWLNTYGPTETAIIATCFCPERHQPVSDPLPIGRPILNNRVYVLNPDLQPVPSGVPGELFIAGHSVARGYLNRPELTAERFLPDPFIPGGRMYRTGDRVCWRPAGDAPGYLEYLGRVDDQVKIRGFRVEPGEIETILRQHPEIAEAAVVPYQIQGEAVRLAAYCVPAEPEAVLSTADLRVYLHERLPDYMVPAAFMTISRLPLTVTGKVDRKALPEPNTADTAVEESDELPQTEIEQTLAAIWQAILGSNHIGRRDNFFALGGDSILSLQVIARARQKGLSLNARDIFEHPTIAELAQAARLDETAVVDQAPVTGVYPLTPIQRYFFDHVAAPSAARPTLANPAHWNQSVLLASDRRLDETQVDLALAAIVTHHDVLRSRFVRDERGSWTAEILPPGPQPRLIARDLANLAPAEQDQALQAACTDLQAGFDLAQPPLLAAGLFWLGPERGARLFLTAHHLIVDTVSWRILLEDLVAALSSPADLPQKSTAYPHWAEHQLKLAAHPEVQDALPYWQGLAWKWFDCLPLPVDGPGGPNFEGAVQSQIFFLDPAETENLLQRAPVNLGSDPTALLLAGLAAAVYQWAGPVMLPIQLERHGRDGLAETGEAGHFDLSRTVGWFTSAFPVFMDLRLTAGSLDENLRSVRDTLQKLPHGGQSFGLLAAHHPDPDIRASLQALAAPPVSFNYLGQFDASLSAGGFSLASESYGPERDPQSERGQLMDISASVSNGQMRLQIAYNPNNYRPETMTRLADLYAASLRSLLALADQSAGAGPAFHLDEVSDVPLSDHDLLNLMAELNEGDSLGGDLNEFDLDAAEEADSGYEDILSISRRNHEE